MVFNLIFHVVWYTVKAIQTLVQRVHSEGDPTMEQPHTTVECAPRPHGDITKLFLTFALTFAVVHHLVTTVASPADRGRRRIAALPAAEPDTCVETNAHNFFCTDKPATAQDRAHKTAQYYLDNFGVAQIIDGSGEENSRMRDLANSMEEYFRTWIAAQDRPEQIKEKCINKHDKCVFWASIKECTKNPGYMDNNCMLACKNCDKLLDPPKGA